MKFLHPHIPHIPPSSAASVGGETRKIRHRPRSSARGVRGVDVLAYTSASPSIQAHAVSLSTPNVQASDRRQPFMHERNRLIVAAIITSLYALLLGLMLYMSIGHASLGVTAKRTANGEWIVTKVVPNGISYNAGVRPGDIVVRQDGPTASQVSPSQETEFPGALTLQVKKAGSNSGSLEVTARDRSGGSPLHRWGFALLSLIFIGIGAPVYVKARQRSAGSTFYLFCIATAVALAIAPAAFLGNGEVMALMFVSMVAWAASFALFFFKFPVRAGKSKFSHSLIISILLGFGIVVLVAYGLVLAGHPDDYVWAQSLQYLYLAVCLLAGLINLGRALLSERSPEIRQQLVLLAGGTALAVGPNLLLYLLPILLFRRYLLPIEITALALGIMPLAFAYAITQHQLLGIRGFVRRSVIYVVMGMGVLLVFALFAALVRAIMPQDWLDQEIGLLGFGLFVFVIAFSYSYVQRRVERLVDRYIYHDAYDYKEALLSFSAQLAAEQNLHVLAEQLVERTCRLMNLNCGVLLLTVREDGYVPLAPYAASSTADQDNASITENGDRGYAGRGYVNTDIAHLQALSKGVSWRDHPIRVTQVHGDGEADLVPYAKYGECADWLIHGLQSELSNLGINLQQVDRPTEVIYLRSNDSAVTVAAGPSGPGHLRSRSRGTQTVPNMERSLQTGTYENELYGPEQKGDIYITGNLMHTPQTEPIRSFLGVPLWTRSRFAGILCLGEKKSGERFTKDDLSLLSTLGSQAALAIYNAQLYEMREQALLDTITALAHAIEAKDNYTINHCENITDRAIALAQSMALPRQEVENIRLGSILHDVGKIGIPDAILNKPGKLTDEEYEIIKQHAAIGARIVQSVGALQGVVPIVRHHQERYDGSGYPDSLVGDAIPIGARIISVVDAYGAMTEDRVYRKAPGHDVAISELKRFAGKQFDPMTVEAFIRLLEDRPDLSTK